MLAEVFAGRIGSPLDTGISLFELDPSDGELVFLAGNNNTLDPTLGTDGSVPLLTDSALSDGLTAGDYYLAVADGSNTPSPIEGQMPGSPGIFDPNQPGSAQLGWSIGPYVLNLLVQPAPNPPRVLASSPSSGQVLDQPPTQLTVQFSEPINIQQLAYQAFEIAAQETLPQVFVEAADGTRYYPRFLAYDRATNQATFQMLDGLPNGSYALHLSGPGGLTDLGGNPIVANDPSGDYVIPFQVQGPASDISGNITDGYTIVSQAGGAVPQDLGVLFPNELQAGVTVIRGPGRRHEPGIPHDGGRLSDPAPSKPKIFLHVERRRSAGRRSGDGVGCLRSGDPAASVGHRNGLFRPADRRDIHGSRRRVDRRPVGERLLPVDDEPGRARRQRSATRGRPGPLASNPPGWRRGHRRDRDGSGRSQRSGSAPGEGGATANLDEGGGSGPGLAFQPGPANVDFRAKCRHRRRAVRPGCEPARRGGHRRRPGGCADPGRREPSRDAGLERLGEPDHA